MTALVSDSLYYKQLDVKTDSSGEVLESVSNLFYAFIQDLTEEILKVHLEF